MVRSVAHAVILAAAESGVRFRVAFGDVGSHGSLQLAAHQIEPVAKLVELIDRLWGMDDLYNAVTEHAAKERAKAKRERWIQRLIDRIERGE
jgi:hypothetical protein